MVDPQHLPLLSATRHRSSDFLIKGATSLRARRLRRSTTCLQRSHVVADCFYSHRSNQYAIRCIVFDDVSSMESVNRHKKKCLLVATLLAIAGAFLYGMIDPASSHFFPRCIFKMVTGYDCPGCGSQRALHALLHGDITSAWRYNAFLVALIPLIILLLTGEYLRVFFPSVIPGSRFLNRLYLFLSSRSFALTILIITLAWWLLRILQSLL